MKHWIAAAAGLALLAPVIGLAPPLAPPIVVYNQTNKHHYEIVGVEDGLTWPDAVKAAALRTYLGVKGNLVAVNDKDEWTFLTGNLYTADCWLGGYQDQGASDYKEPDGGWRWVTGEPMGFASWYDKEPNNSVPEENVTVSRGHAWNDTSFKGKFGAYVVEYPTLGSEPDRGAVKPSVQIEDYIKKVAKSYSAARSYSATIEFTFKMHVNTLDSVRAEIIYQAPGRFRLEGRGIFGRMLAIADGRELLLAVTRPGKRMQYLVKPMPPIGPTLQEAFSLLTDSPKPPPLMAFVAGKVDTRLWGAGGLVGLATDGATPVQVLRSRVGVRLSGEDPMDGEIMVTIDRGTLRAQSCEANFRFKAYPFTVRETHTNVRLNEAVPPGAFMFQAPAGAEMVHDLGEVDEAELEYRVPKWAEGKR